MAASKKRKKRKRLYHGTSLHRFQRMAESGYVTTLYLAESPGGTEMYRIGAFERDTDDGIPEEENAPIVVTFDVEAMLSKGQLEPDWDDVATNMEMFPHATTVREVSWDESLKALGTCAYSGTLDGVVVRVRKFV
jgi:hypothetical protein